MQSQSLTNEQISAKEIAEFKAERPERYFAYHFGLALKPGTRLEVGDTVGTWTGDELARVTWRGEPFVSAFGDTRQNFRAKAITGDVYSGTAYLTAGDYVRMRKVAS